MHNLKIVVTKKFGLPLDYVDTLKRVSTRFKIPHLEKKKAKLTNKQL